jgi:protein-disulfide isomerase
MASGKQSRRKRQASVAQRRVDATRKKPSRTVVAIGAAIVAITIAAIAAAVALSDRSPAPSGMTSARGSLRNALPAAVAVNRLLHGVPQRDNVLGRQDAPVTLVEYIDLQCPYCAAFETEVMPKLIPRYVRRGTVRIEARILAFLGPDSERGRRAAVAAGEQNHLFDFAQLAYAHQGVENGGWLDDAFVRAAASSIPALAVEPVVHATRTPVERRFDEAATRDSVTGTPTILVGRTGAKAVRVNLASPTDAAAVVAAISRASARP